MSAAATGYTLRDMQRKQADLEELVLTRANILAMVDADPVVRPVKIQAPDPVEDVKPVPSKQPAKD